MAHLAHCPTCGFQLGGRPICAHCGTLASIELGLQSWRRRAAEFAGGLQTRVRRGLTATHFLWVCAVVPVVMLPPLASFVLSIVALRRQVDGAADRRFEWIAMISVINVVLSALFLYKYHLTLADIYLSYDRWQALLDAWLRGYGQHPSPMLRQI